MNKLKKTMFLMAMLPVLSWAQHSIKGTFSPPEAFKFALLYKVTPTNSVYIKNSKVNEEGGFTLEMDSTLTKGMYRIVYGLPQEQNNFDVIYNAKEDILFTFNSETGLEYQESNENSLLSSYTYSMSLVSQSIGNFFRQQSSDTLALESIFKTQLETQASYEELAQGTMALHFIRANKPYVPEGFEDIKTYIQNLKIHFFDHVDFNDETLQSSNFLIDRILNYVFGMTSEHDEITTYKQNVDEVGLAMNDTDVIIKKQLLEVLWQQMADAGFDEVANYIADRYLIEISEALNDVESVERFQLFKRLSIGQPAPEIKWESENEDSKIISSLSALTSVEKYLILFWSSTCSHCLEEIPQLKSFLESLDECNMEVVAVGLEDNAVRWNKEILNYPDFIHVLGLDKWENEIAKRYNITSTPSYFVLDKDKNIIAKPDNIEALKKVISSSN